MAKTKAIDPAARLAQDIHQAFERRRTEGTRYPCSLRDVARDVVTEVSDSELLAASTKVPLKKSWIPAIEGDIDSPAVLNDKEDIQRLVGDERVLRLLLERLCSPQLPVVSTTELATAGVLAKKLSTAFKSHWEGRLKTGNIPSFAAVVTIPGKTAKSTTYKLQDLRFPLPWVSLSKSLVQALQQPSPSGGVVTHWSELVSRVPGAAQESIAALARQCEPYKSQVIPVFTKEPLGSLVLLQNVERAVKDPRVFDRVYQATRKPKDTAVDVAALQKSKVFSPELAAVHAWGIERMVAEGTVPPGYGMIRVGTKAFLFRQADVGGAVGTPSAAPSKQPSPEHPAVHSHATADTSGFAAAFTQAFERLDAQDGGYNFVKLLQLRNALPQFSRSTFDAGLEQLRKERQFSLEASEGLLVTLTEQERAAGIIEAGRQLIYCKRIRHV